MTKKLDLDVLRRATNGIFDFIEHDLKMSSVELPHNLYWSVPEKSLYDVAEEQPELNCGSLVDDYEFVSIANNSKGPAVPLVLIHIAPLLRALAHAVPSYKPKAAGTSAK